MHIILFKIAIIDYDVLLTSFYSQAVVSARVLAASKEKKRKEKKRKEKKRKEKKRKEKKGDTRLSFQGR
jgi:hypothetical protein